MRTAPSEDLEAQVEIVRGPPGPRRAPSWSSSLADELERGGRRGHRGPASLPQCRRDDPRGTAEGTVVVGAHHDTKDTRVFEGANDGASGVAVVLELARVLAAEAPLDGPSISLVLFDAEEARGDRPFEEDGTRGSQQYVKYAANERGVQGSTAPRRDRTPMILFDLVGDCELADPPRGVFSDESSLRKL